MSRQRIVPIGFMFSVLVLSAISAWAGVPEEKISTDFRKIVKGAKGKVFPAVVFIRNLSENHESGKKTTQTSMGSGVIIDKSGLVVSNWHVVDKARNDMVRCLLSDGSHYDAKILGTDKDTDLSLLQLQLPKDKKIDLPTASFGDSTKLKEGDFVMAMGAPYGMNRSVSIGIISCTKRYLPGHSEYSKWFQTDAMISPGNSGGPLVDTEGHIIGINTRGGSGHGFAVPSETVEFIAKRLKEFGQVNWSWTGLRLQPLNNFMKDIYFTEFKEGVVVSSIDPESPALRGGFKVRDCILKINGQSVNATWDEDLPKVRRIIGLLPKEKPAEFVVQRGKKIVTLKITPRAKGKVEGEELELPRWDFSAKTINQFENEDLFYYCPKGGVFVYGIKRPGNAAKTDLAEKDIILKIGKTKITSLEDLKAAHKKAMENIKKEYRILITVKRNGSMKKIVLDFARDYEKE